MFKKIFYSKKNLEDAHTKKRTLGVTVFGIMLIIIGILATLTCIGTYLGIKKFPCTNINELIGSPYGKYFTLIFPPSGMVWGVIYIICGIGLLRLKHWARYFIIVLMLVSIIMPVNEALLFGLRSINIVELLIQTGLVFLIVSFFMGKNIKKQFGDKNSKFKLKSIYGILISLILLLSLILPIAALGFKIFLVSTSQEPLFIPKPNVIKLQSKKNLSSLKKYRKVNIFNTTILIPKKFIIKWCYKPYTKFSGWDAILTATSYKNKRGIIMLHSEYEKMLEPFKPAGFKNAYEVEKAILTNNWSPIFMILRGITWSERKHLKLEELASPTFKGFMKSSYDEKKTQWLYQISLYSKDGKFLRDLTIISTNNYFTRNSVLDIISALSFLQEKKSDAKNYYDEGLRLLSLNDFAEAQFKFANAYYLSPQNVEYGYMLARTLLKNGNKNFFGAKRILTEILMLKPNYSDAKKLLVEIKSKSTAKQQMKNQN